MESLDRTTPDDILFYIAERDTTIIEVMHTIYNSPSKATQDHFARVNAHLINNRVRVGQMVIITPEDPLQCSLWEDLLLKAARHIDAELNRQTIQEKAALARNYALFQGVISYSGLGTGLVSGYFNNKASHVEKALKKIEKLYVEQYNKSGALNGADFFQKRRALFLQIDRAVNGMLERRMWGQNVDANRIKSKLGLSSKSVVHQWKAQGYATDIDGFKSNYTRLATASKVFTRLGYVSIALDVAGGASKIAEACSIQPDSAYCTKSKFTETGKVGGSVVGGAAGGAVTSYLVCNMLLGIETFGTSLLWCSIISSAVGGYAGSKGLSKGGEMLGTELYNKTYQVN